MHLIGIDVGGTNFRVGVFSGLDMVFEKRFEADFSALCRLMPNEAQAVILSTLASAISEAMAGFPEAKGIGIGFPGFVDPQSMHIASSPNLPNLLDVDIVGPLSAKFALPVIVENDALAAAYGESFFCGIPSLIYVGLGTGVGGGLVLQGVPYGGEHGVAMEIGHLIVEEGGRPCGCGNCGCLEQYASASGVSKSYLDSSGKKISAKEIAALAIQGDEAAVSAFERAGATMGRAVAHILKVVDIPHIVIGGGLSGSWQLMEPAFRQRLEADLVPVLRGKTSVAVSRAKDSAGMLGAAKLAGNQL